jgi:hypothetical protein
VQKPIVPSSIVSRPATGQAEPRASHCTGGFVWCRRAKVWKSTDGMTGGRRINRQSCREGARLAIASP